MTIETEKSYPNLTFPSDLDEILRLNALNSKDIISKNSLEKFQFLPEDNTELVQLGNEF